MAITLSALYGLMSCITGNSGVFRFGNNHLFGNAEQLLNGLTYHRDMLRKGEELNMKINGLCEKITFTRGFLRKMRKESVGNRYFFAFKAE